MKTLTRFALVAVLSALFVSVFSAGSWATPPIRKQRYEVQLNLSPRPGIGQACTVQLDVKALMDSPQTEIKLTLPKGVELLTGEKKQSISINKAETLQKVWRIRIKEPGNYNIFAWVESPEESGVRNAKIVNLYLVAREEGVTISKVPPKQFYPTWHWEETGEVEFEPLKEIPRKAAKTTSNPTMSGYVKYLNKDPSAPPDDYLPVQGVKVQTYLYGTPVGEDVTDANGYYSVDISSVPILIE